MVDIGFTATDGNTYVFCRSFSTFDEGYFKVIERIQQDRNNNNSSTLRCKDDKYLFTNQIVSIFLIDDDWNLDDDL